jgi:hypothetical protein
MNVLGNCVFSFFTSDLLSQFIPGKMSFFTECVCKCRTYLS